MLQARPKLLRIIKLPTNMNHHFDTSYSFQGSYAIMDFMIGGVAGMGAVLFTNPFDVVKTRMQLQGELEARGKHAVHYSSVPHAMYIILRTEGVTSLQKGLVSALCYQMSLNSMRLGLYHAAEVQGLNRNKDGGISIWKSIVYSALAGTVGGLVGSPPYLIKTQLQAAAHESIAVGKQHKHKGNWHACRSIYTNYGWRGFFQGINSSVFRITIGSAAQLTTFSSVKDTLKIHGICSESPIGLAFLASAVSGVFVVLAACPFDVVSTRLYNQGYDGKNRGVLYSGVWNCLVKIFQMEGFIGYYKGVFPLYLRLAPHTTLSLVFWDKLKLYIK